MPTHPTHPGTQGAKARTPVAALHTKQQTSAMQESQMPRDLPQPGLVQRAQENPSSLNHSDLLYLQRSMGNRAVSDLLARKESPENNAGDAQESAPIGAQGG